MLRIAKTSYSVIRTFVALEAQAIRQRSGTSGQPKAEPLVALAPVILKSPAALFNHPQKVRPRRARSLLHLALRIYLGASTPISTSHLLVSSPRATDA